MLANGFWQAEGYIGGIFRSDLNFYPICTATQLFSEESVKFFLELDYALFNKGTINITLNSLGKFVIQYRLSGWNTFFYVFIPYFYMLYGAKYQAIQKLIKIFELKNLIKNNSDIMLKVLLIKLAYSLTAHTSRYKLSLEDKLISFNIDPTLLDKLSDFCYSENTVSPSFLFVLGFFLGDGSLHLKLEWRDKNSTVVIIPLFNIVQSNIECNKEIMEIITNVLNNLGLKASLSKGNKTFNLTVKGIDNVFNNLFPLLEKYSHFLYWKIDSFNLLRWVKRLMDIGGHHTYLGLNTLINKIYSSTNERFVDKEIWNNRLNSWLKAILDNRKWGEYYIYPLFISNTKEIKGWQVRFPSSLKVPAKSNKAFMCSTNQGQEKALQLAVQYRNKIVLNLINNLD